MRIIGFYFIIILVIIYAIFSFISIGIININQKKLRKYKNHKNSTILLLSLFMNCENRWSRYIELLQSVEYDKYFF